MRISDWSSDVCSSDLDLPDVRPLGFTGYCRDAKAYVFGQYAVSGGRVYRPNDNEFFQIGKEALKLGTSERLLDIDYDADQMDVSWLSDLWTAYGPKGIACLTFYFASLFAEQVRGEMKSFPFLEMHGLPGTGKTTLIEFLWKLMGRSEEHTSELQSLMRISYAVFCLKKKTKLTVLHRSTKQTSHQLATTIHHLM